MAAFLPGFLAALFLVVCILLIVVVLLQKGRGGGLGASFGGGGGGAFGTRTGDVFTWVTIVLTALFLTLAVVTTVAHRRQPDVVAAPQFTPSGHPIRQPIEVRMRCLTTGAQIHYTLDGSEPTRQSAEYADEPVTVRPGQVLKAVAYRAGWGTSDVTVAQYPPVGDGGRQPTTPVPTTMSIGQPATLPAGSP